MSDEARHVLDASALIALIWSEPGASTVRRLLGRVTISTVNWTEVLQCYLRQGMSIEDKQESVEAMGVHVEAYTREDAQAAAELWAPTRTAGLSLADRACLALARRLGAAAYTADRAWAKLDTGAEIVLIR